MREPLFIQDCGVVTSLGRGKLAVAHAIFSGDTNGISLRDNLAPDRQIFVGAMEGDLPAVPEALAYLDCRNNRLMQLALMEITPAVHKAAVRYGKDRVAVILGTSTSGIAGGEEAYASYVENGVWPDNYHYHQQELSSLNRFASEFLGLTGPTYTVATACSSSAKVFASARRLIEAGIVDAAVVGGADTLCRMTLRGFASLEIVSSKRCNPFSLNRDGITIGEGCAAFLLSREEGPVQLLGVGETSDAYHLTAPDPEGKGACEAMTQALADASLTPQDICYINLHGTATPLNDAMEGHAVTSVFGDDVLCSSTKGMTGHMLGAAGACEAAFLWLTLNPATNPGFLPPHLWDGEADPALPPLKFVTPQTKLPDRKSLAMLSNSFGFGGSNVSLIFGRDNDMMPPIADLLPHAPPMVLLDEVLHWKAGEVTVAVTIADSSPFFIADIGVPAHVGLEYMAQACGAYAGLEGLNQQLPVRMGFLLGTRNFSATIKGFKRGDRLIVTASEILRHEQMGVFNCTIVLNGEEVAQAQLTVYQPDNVDAILNETLG